MPTTTHTPPPYPAYQHAGLPWLDEAPAHWELPRFKNVLTERSEKGFPEEPLLAATQTKGVVPKEDYEIRTVVAMKDLHLLKIVRVGDFVISLRSFEGGIEYAREQGIISPAYTIIYPTNPDTHSYLAWLFKSHPYIENLKWHVTGIRQGQNIDYQDLRRSRIPLPPPDEQAAIVRYLDAADGQLRQRRDARRRLLSLRRAERQALIHQTVTQGLRPNAPQRPAGLPYLPTIPAHWEVRRLKHWVGINQATLSELTDPDFEFRYLEIGAVSAGAITSEPARIRFANAPSRARRIVRNGDTIISTVRTYLKAVWFAENLDDNLICSTGFAVLTPNQETVPKFVSYLVQSNAFTDRVSAESIGVAYPAISESKLSSFPVAVPPPDEQAEIVAFLDGEMGRIDAAMARDRRLAELYDEYRLRLMADAVTGRLDVRQAPEPSGLIPMAA